MNAKYLRISLSTLIILGLCSRSEGANIQPFRKSLSIIRIQQCREGCLEKFAIKESLCQQRPECSMSGFPPYNYNSLPDALHLLCWDECAKPPPPKINKTILETWALHTVSMHRKGSLVLVDVAWAPFNTPNQCLVTWEVSGGGLMGNLLTESTNVQLSLWPDTKYRVQVTCKNKVSGAMSRSLPLTIDTAEANTETNLDNSPSTHSPSIALNKVATKSVIVVTPPVSSSSILSSDKKQITNNNDKYHNAILSEINTNDDATANIRNTFDTHLNNDFDHFDWHDTIDNNNYNNNNDNNNEDDRSSNGEVTIDKIAISNSDDIKILTIAALSRTQIPLIYGIIAGIFLLAVILCLHVFILRSKRISSDKKTLIDDDGNATNNVILPTSLMITNNNDNGCNNTDGMRGLGNDYRNINNGHRSNNDGEYGVDDRNGSYIGCAKNNNGSNDLTNHFNSDMPIIDPVMYSRTVHVLTV